MLLLKNVKNGQPANRSCQRWKSSSNKQITPLVLGLPIAIPHGTLGSLPRPYQGQTQAPLRAPQHEAAEEPQPGTATDVARDGLGSWTRSPSGPAHTSRPSFSV